VLGCGAAAWVIGRPLNYVLRTVFTSFNRGFQRTTHAYTRAIGALLRVAGITLIVYTGLLALTYGGFVSTPRGFIPSQDMGYLMVAVQLPDSASTERTAAVMRKLDKIARDHPGVRHATAINRPVVSPSTPPARTSAPCSSTCATTPNVVIPLPCLTRAIRTR